MPLLKETSCQLQIILSLFSSSMLFKLQTNSFWLWNIALGVILVSIFRSKITSLRIDQRFTLQKLSLRLKIFIDEESYFEI